MADQLGAIASSSAEQKHKIEQYKAALSSFAAAASAADLRAFIDHMLSDDVPLVISRQLLQQLAETLRSLPPAVMTDVGSHALVRIQPRVVSFEEQVSIVRETLAAHFETEEDWSRAAQLLAGIDLDSGLRVLDDTYKFEKCVKISMLYLEDDDAVQADHFIKKAASLLGGCKDEALELQFKTCYARILDSKRKFLEAAMRYYELSTLEKRSYGGQEVSDEDLAMALNQAVTCTILAGAGPQRTRLLTMMYKDERCASLPVYGVLEKVYLERILRKAEVEQFSRSLKPHQVAMGGDGLSVLERSMIEHNLQSVSKLYNNIYLSELGELLGIDASAAEKAAGRMIVEERLKGSIDQVDAIIYFESNKEVTELWDQQIADVCLAVNSVVDQLDARGFAVSS